VSWRSSTCGSASGDSLSSATLSLYLLNNVEDSGVVEDSSVSVAAPLVVMVVISCVDGASDVGGDVGGASDEGGDVGCASDVGGDGVGASDGGGVGV